MEAECNGKEKWEVEQSSIVREKEFKNTFKYSGITLKFFYLAQG
jgi:hypothetical protein